MRPTEAEAFSGTVATCGERGLCRHAFHALWSSTFVLNVPSPASSPARCYSPALSTALR